MDSVGLSQVKFAEKCGIRPSNFNQMLDANTSHVGQNIIRGDNYQGTQTINATEGKIMALEQKIDAQAQLLAEKDRLIASQQHEIEFLRGLVNKQQQKGGR